MSRKARSAHLLGYLGAIVAVISSLFLLQILPGLTARSAGPVLLGAVTLVARRGKIAHFEAQGVMDVDTKKPMAKDNLFRLASMSKPITGVAVMMLVEEGKIRLNDPVSRFIPEFANLNKVAVPRPGASAAPQGRQGGAAAAPQYDVVSANRQITIADLLKHGSGLVSGGLGAADAADAFAAGAGDVAAAGDADGDGSDGRGGFAGVEHAAG